jgi:Phosphotransferase enzyme family
VNAVAAYLRRNEVELGHAPSCSIERLSCVLVTPRFRASRHVVMLFLEPGRGEPLVVAKIARLLDDRGSLAREAANLRAVQASRAAGFDTIPRLIALDSIAGRATLIETALPGRPIDPGTIRRRLVAAVDAVTTWLDELQTPDPTRLDDSWFGRLLEQPLERLASLCAPASEELQLARRTLDLLEPIRHERVPLVIEHGDLSQPNLVWLPDGRAGVVDWEFAEPEGLPLLDLSFFLNYAATAAAGARTEAEAVAAFHRAFVGRDTWCTRALCAYASRLRIPERLMTPLFVASWARYAAKMILLEPAPEHVPTGGLEPALRRESRFHLWRHAVENVEAFRWAVP